MFGVHVGCQHRCNLILAEYPAAKQDGKVGLFQGRGGGNLFFSFTYHQATTIKVQNHGWTISTKFYSREKQE